MCLYNIETLVGRVHTNFVVTRALFTTNCITCKQTQYINVYRRVLNFICLCVWSTMSMKTFAETMETVVTGFSEIQKRVNI